MDEYRIPFENAESEFTEKRSRFISNLWHIESETEARAHIEDMRRRYYDASHHCWCYLLREGNVLRYSDDGEPQGTAGQPMLEVFRREGVTDLCCVVTRYFGGILLGAGGLTRAYAQGAKDALNAAGIAKVSLWSTWDLPCPYPLLERIRQETSLHGGVIRSADYGEDVRLRLAFPADSAEAFSERLREISSGGLTMRSVGEEYLPGKREEAK